MRYRQLLRQKFKSGWITTTLHALAVFGKSAWDTEISWIHGCVLHTSREKAKRWRFWSRGFRTWSHLPRTESSSKFRTYGFWITRIEEAMRELLGTNCRWRWYYTMLTVVGGWTITSPWVQSGTQHNCVLESYIYTHNSSRDSYLFQNVPQIILTY